MILHRDAENTELDVVDGQQRLLTLLMLRNILAGSSTAVSLPVRILQRRSSGPACAADVSRIWTTTRSSGVVHRCELLS